MELEQPCYHTATFAHSLCALWPIPKDMFPWWHQANAELVHSAELQSTSSGNTNWTRGHSGHVREQRHSVIKLSRD